MLKRNFKALRAQKLVGQIHDSHEVMIEKAWNKVKKKDIIACVRHVNDLIK